MGELIDRDQEHLRLLYIAFYVMAGVSAFISLFALVYIGIGSVVAAGVLNQMANSSSNPFPSQLGWIFVVLGVFFLMIGVTVTFLLFLAGKSLQQRHRRTFCMVMAGLCCLQVPWGTVIGVCAINVLNRPSVRMLFEAPTPPAL